MPRGCPKRLLSIPLPPHSALSGMEMQKVHREKLCKVMECCNMEYIAFAGHKLSVTPAERRLHLPSRAALFPLGGLVCQGQQWSKNWENLLVQLQIWLLSPNTSVNEIIVFCLEEGLGEVCSIPRLHCKSYCEFNTHPFFLPCAGDTFSDKNL